MSLNADGVEGRRPRLGLNLETLVLEDVGVRGVADGSRSRRSGTSIDDPDTRDSRTSRSANRNVVVDTRNLDDVTAGNRDVEQRRTKQGRKARRCNTSINTESDDTIVGNKVRTSKNVLAGRRVGVVSVRREAVPDIEVLAHERRVAR